MNTMIVTKTAFIFQLIYSLSILSSINSFDIILSDVSCDKSLPVYVYQNEMKLSCNGTDRCTFGNEAVLSTNLTYNGLEYEDLTDGYAYISAHLSFQTLDYDLFEDLPINMCGSYVGLMNYGDDDYAQYNDDGNFCPADGTYTANIPYTLPNIGTPIGSWLSTGWKGSGSFMLSTTAGDFYNKIGFCKFELITDVTRKNAQPNELQYYIPNAFLSAIIVFGIAALIVLSCMCRTFHDCCCSSNNNKNKNRSNIQDETLSEPMCCGNTDDDYELQKEFDPVLMNRSTETDDSYRRFKH